MTKAPAVVELMQQARSERQVSTTAAKRVVKACRALGLDDDDVRYVCSWLDFCRPDGTPYSEHVQRVWP